MVKLLTICSVCLILFSCSRQSESEIKLIQLAEKNIQLINDLSKNCLWSIEKSYLENSKKAGPFYKRAIIVNSLTENFLLDVKTFQLNPKRKDFKILNLNYHKTIDTLLTFIADSHFQMDTSLLFKAKNSEKENILSMKMELVNLNYHVLRFIMGSVDGTYCGFLPIEIIFEEQKTDEQHALILKSEYFQKFKDRYVNVDSIVKNGKKIDVALKSSENFTFSQINLDSLEKGNYQLFGKVFSFSPVTDYKIEENFDFQFTKD